MSWGFVAAAVIVAGASAASAESARKSRSNAARKEREQQEQIEKERQAEIKRSEQARQDELAATAQRQSSQRSSIRENRLRRRGRQSTIVAGGNPTTLG